ncbi:MAG: aminotransferase class I/II-fold pyridoxal phosphate-dependent enzyme [Cyanobacteriota bacterium]|nr:aminotransferase class I/II-fold pyridoxal phosphate-dependent enzyme [Cyanobacteriota bacterium]
MLAAESPVLALHLPAHGRGRALPPPLRRLLRRPPGSWDLPELPALGGPLEPHGAVAAAQQRAADLLGAERCWFGVNGASGMLQVALLALAAPGQRVLLPRNLHRSLLHGCVLGGLEPVLFDTSSDPLTGIRLPPTPVDLVRVLERCGPVAALVLVDPTYHGLAADLAALVGLAHRHGLPVLVDQAHGRGEALAAGADLVVLSPQKAGVGLAQGAVLLAQGPRVTAEAVERALLWLQTSSPSALLLAASAAAIDWQCAPAGARRHRRALAVANGLRGVLHHRNLPLLTSQDPLRLTVVTAAMGIAGPVADAWLMERGVVAELPEPGALTFCLGLAPPAGLRHQLPRQLLALQHALADRPLPPFQPPPLPLVAAPELPLHQAWRAPCQHLPLAQAAGQIVARPVCPYPPGIPLLIPGERLDPARLAWLERQRQLWPDQVADTVAVVV